MAEKGTDPDVPGVRTHKVTPTLSLAFSQVILRLLIMLLYLPSFVVVVVVVVL